MLAVFASCVDSSTPIREASSAQTPVKRHCARETQSQWEVRMLQGLGGHTHTKNTSLPIVGANLGIGVLRPSGVCVCSDNHTHTHTQAGKYKKVTGNDGSTSPRCVCVCVCLCVACSALVQAALVVVVVWFSWGRGDRRPVKTRSVR